MDFSRDQFGYSFGETLGYSPAGTPAYPFEMTSAYSFSGTSPYPRQPSQPHGMPYFPPTAQGINTAPTFTPTTQAYQYPSDMPRFPQASPVLAQPYQRMQSQEQQMRLADANARIQLLERQLAIATGRAAEWERVAKHFEALAKEREPKPVVATTMLQSPGSGIIGLAQGPQEAQITAARPSLTASDKVTIDLTGGEQFEAAPLSPDSSDPAASKSSSQSPNSGSSCADDTRYGWLPGGHPLRSRKRPRPYGPEQLGERPDNTPQFGSYMSTADGRKLYSEVEGEARAGKMRRLDKPQKPKATSRSKALPKPPCATKGKKTKTASAAAVEDVKRENEQHSIQASPAQQSSVSAASNASSEIVVTTSTSDNILVDASAAAVEDVNRENEQHSIQAPPAQQSSFSTASSASSDTVVTTSTSDNLVVDDDGDLDSLFEEDPNEIEDVASIPGPPIPDGAKEETLDDMAADMEAALEAFPD